MILSTSRVLLHVACVSFPASSSASADKRAPHRQWHLTLLVAWGHSLRESLVCQPLADSAVNEAIKSHKRMVLDVTLIQPKGKFVNITTEMLAASYFPAQN
jgi:hypothetical protein